MQVWLFVLMAVGDKQSRANGRHNWSGEGSENARVSEMFLNWLIITSIVARLSSQVMSFPLVPVSSCVKGAEMEPRSPNTLPRSRFTSLRNRSPISALPGIKQQAVRLEHVRPDTADRHKTSLCCFCYVEHRKL